MTALAFGFGRNLARWTLATCFEVGISIKTNRTPLSLMLTAFRCTNCFSSVKPSWTGLTVQLPRLVRERISFAWYTPLFYQIKMRSWTAWNTSDRPFKRCYLTCFTWLTFCCSTHILVGIDGTFDAFRLSKVRAKTSFWTFQT